jgi:hypothetical protein
MALKTSVASALLLLTLVAIGFALAGAPLHRRYTASECRAAYAKARSHTDTAHVDLRRYRPASGASADHRCGEVRAVPVGVAADFSRP